jgi:hypothetical protein
MAGLWGGGRTTAPSSTRRRKQAYGVRARTADPNLATPACVPRGAREWGARAHSRPPRPHAPTRPRAHAPTPPRPRTRHPFGTHPSVRPPARLAALSVAAKLVRLALELAAQCSRREQGGEVPLAADLQPVLLWLPLLQQALRRLRSPAMLAWQGRIVWHATRRLTAAVSAALLRPPEPPPASVVAAAAAEEEEGKGWPLRFVPGQMLLLRGDTEAGGGAAGEAARPPTAAGGDAAGGDGADDGAADGRGAGGGADFCVPLLCEGAGARRLVEGAASGSAGEEPASYELSYDELYHGRAIGTVPPPAAAAASFAQRLSRRLETRPQRVSLQAGDRREIGGR